MKRYFFNIKNSETDIDHEGVELSSPDEARVAAVIFAGDYLRDDPELIWDGHRLCIEAVDENGVVLLRVDITAADPNAPDAP